MPEPGLSAAWRRLLAWWINHLHKCSLYVVLGALVLSAAACGYALPHLGINTSTEDMISADVAFRRHKAAFVEAFPAVQALDRRGGRRRRRRNGSKKQPRR